MDVAHVFNGSDALLDLLGDGERGGAALGGERHFDGDISGIVVLDVVNQAEIHDIDGDFRIVALAQGVVNALTGEWHGHPPSKRIQQIGWEASRKRRSWSGG